MDFYLINAEPLARACKTGMCGGKIIKGSLVRRMLRNYSLGLDCLLLKLERKFLPSPTSTADVEAMCGNVGLERELESGETVHIKMAVSLAMAGTPCFLL